MELKSAVSSPGLTTLSGTPEGLDALAVSDLARAAAPAVVVHVARDDQRLRTLHDGLAFFAPDIAVMRFPAWDCLPYDRVSPVAQIIARRMATLARLAEGRTGETPLIVLTTVNAVIQRVPPAEIVTGSSLSLAPGKTVSTDDLQVYLTENGFSRTGTVVDPGDYAVRGGIIDIFAPGADQPVRLDFFGDTLESLETVRPPVTTHSRAVARPGSGSGQ